MVDLLADEPDDMNDDGSGEVGPLRGYVRFAYDSLFPLFHETDQSAQREQSRHRGLTYKAALYGALAILVGILGLAMPPTGNELVPVLFMFIELVLAGRTAWLVLWGVYKYRREDWLLHRWQAEQLRLLKYSFLIDPHLWKSGGTGSAPNKEDLERRRDAIGALDEEDLPGLSHDERIPSFPTPAECTGMSRGDVEPLVGYYRQHRLKLQLEYFRKKTQATREWYDRPEALPMFFFGGVVFVFLHVFWEGGQLLTHSHDEHGIGSLVGRLLVFVSAALPTVWAAIRTNRQAQEFSRNLLRSHARHAALLRIHGRLGGHFSAAESDLRLLESKGAHSAEADLRVRDEIVEVPEPVTAFSYMQLAEFILASDQREWLRLMREAEWYG